MTARIYEHFTVSQIVEGLETPDLLAVIEEVTGRKDGDPYFVTDTAGRGVVIRSETGVKLTRRQSLDGLTIELMARLTDDPSSPLHDATIDQRITVARLAGQAPYVRLTATRHGDALIIDLDAQAMRDAGDRLADARRVIPSGGIIVTSTGRTPRAHPDDCRAALRGLGDRRANMLRELQEWPALLGEQVAAAKAAGLSLTEIADLAGVTRQTVYAAIKHA